MKMYANLWAVIYAAEYEIMGTFSFFMHGNRIEETMLFLSHLK